MNTDLPQKCVFCGFNCTDSQRLVRVQKANGISHAICLTKYEGPSGLAVLENRKNDVAVESTKGKE